MGVELFDARFAAELHLLTVVGFGHGVAHGIEAVIAHKADLEGVGFCVACHGFGGGAAAHEGEEKDRLEEDFAFHRNGVEEFGCDES